MSKAGPWRIDYKSEGVWKEGHLRFRTRAEAREEMREWRKAPGFDSYRVGKDGQRKVHGYLLIIKDANIEVVSSYNDPLNYPGKRKPTSEGYVLSRWDGDVDAKVCFARKRDATDCKRASSHELNALYYFVHTVYEDEL